MNSIKINKDEFEILKNISKDPKISQRILSEILDFSLGKLNYCLRALKGKGYIKIKNFANNKNKLVYRYLLTPKGIQQKTKLSLIFIKKKMKEYDELKKEIEKIK